VVKALAEAKVLVGLAVTAALVQMTTAVAVKDLLVVAADS
jgi:hypothetical protein